jgi:dTDP-4-dehydrorhamnose reductase
MTGGLTRVKILVTGASGFLGDAVCRRLGREHDVVGLCHRHVGGSLLSCDIREASVFREVLRQCRPGLVIHAAAYRDPDFCEANPVECERLNVEPARVLAESLPPEARIILISSDYVFDGERPPYDEADARHPVNIYGQSKVAAEDLVSRHPGALVVRIPVLIGVGATLADSGYIGQLVAAVRAGKPVEEDNHFVRHPTWIEDVAECLAFLTAAETRGVIHCSSAEGATRYESAVAVAAALGHRADHLRPAAASTARLAARPRNARLDTTRLRSLGFDRFTPFADVLRLVTGGIGGDN